MEYIAGITLAIALGTFATVIGFDKDRSFYAIVLIVIASYYVLFAVVSGSNKAAIAEAIPVAFFVAIASLGFRKWPSLIVIGLVGHALFDVLHGSLIDNPGVPPWWPSFCAAYDITAGIYLTGLLLVRSKR